jgi:hypothetical protein
MDGDAARDSVGVTASIAATASMTNPNFIARKEPSIVASGTKLFIQPARCSDTATSDFRN